MSVVNSLKIVLYVRTVELPSGRFVDREGALHACAQAGSLPFQGLKGASHLIGRVYLDADWQALCIAQALQENKGVEVEVVDVSRSFWLRRKLRRLGIRKTPQFVVDGQLLPTITSVEQLGSFCI
jgi:hypothetical protein